MTTTKPVLAVDIDDVLVLSEDELMAYYNRTHGTNVSHDDMTEGVAEALMAVGHDRNQIVDRMEEFLLSDDFLALEPIEEAIAVIEDLRQKFRLVAVTGRGSYLEKQTLAWLEKHFSKVFESVHIVGQARWGEGFKVDKQSVFRHLGVSVVVDDSLNTCRNSAANGIEALLFGSYSWNRSDQLAAGVTRVHSWPEIKQILIGE